MTIVIALKVGDGLVLGADSASTITNGNTYHNSYFNAEKLFNLVKGLPLGAVTFGLGGLQNRSISSLVKDLRAMMSDQGQAQWYLDPATYRVEDVVDKLVAFFHTQLFLTEFGNDANAPQMGFLVGGYSSGSRSAEIWRIDISGAGATKTLVCDAAAQWHAVWEGQPEAITRLLLGYSIELVDRLVAAGMTPTDAINLVQTVSPIVHPTMPIQDAIDLVHYLIDVTCGYVRFAPGHGTVAHPMDSAAITPHEGFRWVKRKHYFSREFNQQ